jgi:hypothetical protein
VSQATSNLAVRFARAQPRIEGTIGEQGVSQGVEAVSFVNLAEFGRGSKRRNGPAIGFNLAVADEPFQERTNLCCVGRNSFWPQNPRLNREFLEKM